MAHRITEILTVEGNRLSAVKNPDGFLLRTDTRERIFSETGLLLLPIKSSIELRVRYELEDKHSGERICYVVDSVDWILPDIKDSLYIIPTFSVSRLLPACNELELLQSGLSFPVVSYIFDRKIVKTLSAGETRFLIDEARSSCGMDIGEIRTKLMETPLDWESGETIERISRIVLEAISHGVYNEIESEIGVLNADFQNFIDNGYFAVINSSPLMKPRIVSKILPYLLNKHGGGDKVVLFVVDGMTYWQYLILDDALNNIGIETKKDITFAWIPTITKLSRQAIFRGESPVEDYKQSPTEECRLWMNYWSSSQISLHTYVTNYSHGNMKIEPGTIRQALVDVSLDKKMHSSSNNRDLYALTRNWAEGIVKDIRAIYEQGYQIYITTDHGNILANPWRSLTSQEKTYLFENESRGHRHLIYSKSEYLRTFLQSNPEIGDELFVRENWAVWRTDKSFSDSCGVTHGGSHFLEVIVPFVTIENWR